MITDSGKPRVDGPVTVTHGHLLDGRVRYAQPRRGFRSGIEPVLLAAAIPARPGSACWRAAAARARRCFAWPRACPGVQGLGIERDPALVALARQNAAANGWPDLRFIAADIASLPALGAFDHACANPPYHSDCRHAIAGRVAPGGKARRRQGCWPSGPPPWRARCDRAAR